jgi:hypothetical protein
MSADSFLEITRSHGKTAFTLQAKQTPDRFLPELFPSAASV